MTVEQHSQEEETVHGSLLQKLTLVFAGATLLFAVFSIVTGNHLSTLRADHLEVAAKNNSLETESLAEMRSALENANTNLEAAKQETLIERQNTKKLNQKLSVTQKELEKIKADLDAAKQALASLKTSPPAIQETPVDLSNPGSSPESGGSIQPQPPRNEIPPPQQSPQPSEQPAAPTEQPAAPMLPDQSPVAPPAEKPFTQSSSTAPETDSSVSLPPVATDQQPAPVGSPMAEITVSDSTPPSAPPPEEAE